jgi:hypothetical protein
MIISKRFSSIFILGDNIFLRNFLSNINVPKKLIIEDKFNFNIYTYGGIDFINVELNLDEIGEIFKLNRIIKNFIKKNNYLLSNILYFTTYVNPKQYQILSILSDSNVNMSIVTLKPTVTLDEYINICNELNLKTFIVKDYNIIKTDFLKIIKIMYDCEYEYIYNLFINIINCK